MTMYLNQNNDTFIRDRNDPIYVDKSLIIKETNANFNTGSGRFMCVTRPRRFGKTMALSMLNAYYSKGCDSKELFKDLKIAGDSSFEEHLNKHNVIRIDMAAIYTRIDDKAAFVTKVKSDLLRDLREEYPSLDLSSCLLEEALIAIKNAYGDRFVFLIDEWDVIYREQESNTKLCDEYTDFLRSLFKSSDVSNCVDLVYMTGILPIRRYKTQSALNMFTEYNMLEPRNIAGLFGFTEDEVRSLCSEYGRDFSEIKKWYDGYRLGGLDVYNPKSVVEAITLGRCGDYWVATSSVEAVANYMNFDGGALKGEIISMLNGLSTEVNPGKFDNDLSKIDSKDAALTVLVHLGYLAYLPPEIPGEKGSCYIPNKEISLKFERAMEKLDWHDLYDPIGNSMKL